jgi:hypothetical protein
VSDGPAEDPGDDPEYDDPDFIGQDGAHEVAVVGGLGWGSMSHPTPVFVPKASTPLEAEDDVGGVIPAFALWAMKYKRHGQLFSRADIDVRECFGRADHAVYVIDDGRTHCMVSRRVGTGVDGCTYCLAGRIDLTAYQALVDDETLAADIFIQADDLCLVVVFEAPEAVSNVSSVLDFASIDEVPIEYLPPSPALVFGETPGGAD